MAVTIPQRMVRALIKLVEDPQLSASDRLEAAKQLADCIRAGIGSRRREAKKTAAASAGLLG